MGRYVTSLYVVADCDGNDESSDLSAFLIQPWTHTFVLIFFYSPVPQGGICVLEQSSKLEDDSLDHG